MPDSRLAFLRRWWPRACQATDPFDRFFFLWISVIVAARIASLGGIRYEDDSDRHLVTDYFRVNSARVLEVIGLRRPEMEWLASRRGKPEGHPIVDTGDRRLRERFRRLSAHYTRGASLPSDEHVDVLAALL